jgi:quinol-cytochrome oxidoreductase complex cytochrome b subunit
VKVPREIVKTRTTLRLGFIAATLYMILFISGMYLMFFYHPAPPDAYFDMHSLSTAVAFGQFVRNVHRWSAHLMVLVVFLHLLRVFYAGAYRQPRQFNWVIGVVLLVLTLFMSFTGYLLPWDQLSYWAITVGTNIAGYVPVLGNQVRSLLLGGNEVSAATLLRFYVLHIYFIPALMTLVIAIHIWRVRKDNFAVVDRKSEEPTAEEPAAEPLEVHDVDA